MPPAVEVPGPNLRPPGKSSVWLAMVWRTPSSGETIPHLSIQMSIMAKWKHTQRKIFTKLWKMTAGSREDSSRLCSSMALGSSRPETYPVQCCLQNHLWPLQTPLQTHPVWNLEGEFVSFTCYLLRQLLQYFGWSALLITCYNQEQDLQGGWKSPY